MTDKVVVIARIEIRPDSADEAEPLLQALVDAAKDEQGTEAYALVREGPTFWFFELYADADALALHGKSPALAEAFGGPLGGMVAAPPELHTTVPIAAKGIPF